MNARRESEENVTINWEDFLDDVPLQNISVVPIEKAQEVAHELCSAAIAICKAIDGELGHVIESQQGEFEVCQFMNVHTHEVQERRMLGFSREELLEYTNKYVKELRSLSCELMARADQVTHEMQERRMRDDKKEEERTH